MADPAKGIALSLGGGGIRGIAHVLAIEALDEMGVPVTSITGASIGAIVGAMRAAGIRGADMRRLILEIAASRMGLAYRMWAANGVNLTFFGSKADGWAPVEGRALLAAMLPPGMPDRIEDLPIPFIAVATDLLTETPVDFRQGPLLDVLAASSAIPGLMRAVRMGDRTYVDGAVLDPVPVRRTADASPILAIDLTGEPLAIGEALPHALVSATRATQMMVRYVAASRLAESKPDVLLRPAVHRWIEVEFHRAGEIVNALEFTFKGEVKRAVEKLVQAEPR